MRIWLIRYGTCLLLIAAALCAATAMCGCSAEEATAWTPVMREAIIAVVAVVGLNLHRNRTRSKAIEKLRGK